MYIIVMGVAGSGKSTIGKNLAGFLDVDFLEGDDYHTAENVSLMSAGVPLNDDNRAPWLTILNQTMSQRVAQQQGFVLACSALKKTYRQQLINNIDNLKFVYLKGSRAEIHSRMAARENHFMSLSLIDSQFEALEEPDQEENLITVSINNPVQQVVDQIAQTL
ncbi:MAG: gluconokinase [Pseudomonadales bacterium]|nr:gluconokinase [Pseudomonadales bacterium]NRA14916.1 gluconokinase [Oceanospirillaceae bacterium]